MKPAPKGLDTSKIPGITPEQLKESVAAAKKMPSWSEIKSAFGEQAVQNKRVNLDENTREGRENRRKMLDLMSPAWRAEAERGTRANARIVKEELRTSDGRSMFPAAAFAEQVANERGMKPVVHYGGTRLVAGPDGMIFALTRAYRWEPTGRCFPGKGVSWLDRPYATGVQRDPDGGLWEQIEDRWVNG